MLTPIESVIREALSRDLRVERLATHSKGQTFDRRLLSIEGKRCQVIPVHPAKNPYGEYFPLYLPRTHWPDFLIYVTLIGPRPVFTIIPRQKMSKDTGWTVERMQPYRDAWDSLKQALPIASRKFETLSWQLRAVTRSAKKAGLEVKFIETKKKQEGRRWPPVIKRRILIGGRRCAIFSAVRLGRRPDNQRYNHVVVKASKEAWPEFQLHVVKNVGTSCDVFVIPRRNITATTSASLDNPKLAQYKNAWTLFTGNAESLTSTSPIEWKNPIAPSTPTKHFVMLQEAIRAAESYALTTKSAQDESITRGARQSFLYVAGKRCQVIQANEAIHRPTSNWPEFIIAYSGSANFYVIPQKELANRSQQSVRSKWVKQFENAWHLLVEASG